MAYQWPAPQGVDSEQVSKNYDQLTLALPNPKDTNQFELPLFGEKAKEIVSGNSNIEFSPEKESFWTAYRDWIKGFKEMMSVWDNKAAIIILEALIDESKRYLMENSNNIWEHYDVMVSFNTIREQISKMFSPEATWPEAEWKETLIRTISDAIDSIAFIAFTSFHNRRTNDRNFNNWVNNFILTFWNEIPLVKKEWRNLWELAFTCIWHMSEFVMLSSSEKLVIPEDIVNMIENNSWNRAFIMLCASFLGETTKLARIQWRNDIIARLFKLWEKLADACKNDGQLMNYVFYKIVWNRSWKARN